MTYGEDRLSDSIRQLHELNIALKYFREYCQTTFQTEGKVSFDGYFRWLRTQENAALKQVNSFHAEVEKDRSR